LPTGSHNYIDKNITTKQKQQLSPLPVSKTIINQTGSNPPSDFSDNKNDWETVTQDSGKRHRSPSTLTSPHPKNDSSLFISPNRFSPLAPLIEDTQMITDNAEHSQEAN